MCSNVQLLSHDMSCCIVKILCAVAGGILFSGCLSSVRFLWKPAQKVGLNFCKFTLDMHSCWWWESRSVRPLICPMLVNAILSVSCKSLVSCWIMYSCTHVLSHSNQSLHLLSAVKPHLRWVVLCYTQSSPTMITYCWTTQAPTLKKNALLPPAVIPFIKCSGFWSFY